jgi:hypothetical protein
MKIIKRGRKQPKEKTVEEVMTEYYAHLSRPPFPANWRGPHTCPNCSCIFELEDNEKDLVSIPEIAMGYDADYYCVNCPHCKRGQIRL